MRFILFLSLCIVTRWGYSQSFVAHIDRDTTLSNGFQIKFYTTLDSLFGDTLFDMDSPRGYVIEANGSSGGILLALQTKKGYAVFNACPNDEYAWSYSFSRINFNGKGHDELMISWNGGMGRSGFMDGWNETTGGLYLWDVDHAELIFEIQDHYEYNYWWTGAETDSMGDLMQDSLGNVIFNDSSAGGESSCENYDVDIAYKLITVKPSPACNITYDDTEEHDSESEKIRIYKWTKSGLIEQE